MLIDFGFVQLLPTDLPPSGNPSMLDPLEANGAVFPTAPCDPSVELLIFMHPTTCCCQVRQSSWHPRRAKRVSTRGTIEARGRQAVPAGTRTRRPQATRATRRRCFCPRLISNTAAELKSRPNKACTRLLSSLSNPQVAAAEYQSGTSADVFSYGITLWQIASRATLYPRLYPEDVAEKVKNGLRPELVPAWPAAFKQLLAECWSYDPAGRPQMPQVTPPTPALQTPALQTPAPPPRQHYRTILHDKVVYLPLHDSYLHA